MMEKFIEAGDICLRVGKPTTLGWLVLVFLVVLSVVGWSKTR